MIYLDYAATAPLRDEAKTAMEELWAKPQSGLFDGAANANGLYSAARTAFHRLEEARATVASALGADRPSELLFTSGATEADNAALIGISLAAREQRPHCKNPQVIVSALEHDAVLKTRVLLQRLGFSVREIRPDSSGFIEVRALEEALCDETLLVSVALANGEVGSIQPIKELCALTHKQGAYFHSDAVQALGKIPLNVQDLGCDAVTISSHKVGGPSGIGALYLRRQTPFEPLMVGGGQENGRRSGTQNVSGALGFAVTVREAVREQESEGERLRVLRDRLYEALQTSKFIESTVDVEPGSRDFLCSIASFLFDGFESETLVLRYDALGFCVSGGSACSSKSLEPSHVLRSMGISTDKARGALRVSMGKETTSDDVEAFIAATDKVLAWE